MKAFGGKSLAVKGVDLLGQRLRDRNPRILLAN
jgi:hypothetical protein